MLGKRLVKPASTNIKPFYRLVSLNITFYFIEKYINYPTFQRQISKQFI